MTINKSIICVVAEELKFDTDELDGSWQLVGTLEENPVHIIFDNESDVEVEVGTDADTVWKTFGAGTAVLLDMRANHGIADNMTFRKGKRFYIKSTAGAAGNFFSISYTYADPTTIWS